MRYTPSETFAWANLVRNRRRGELAENLIVSLLGARGDADGIDKQMKDWADG